jgi:hypothetical protein
LKIKNKAKIILKQQEVKQAIIRPLVEVEQAIIRQPVEMEQAIIRQPVEEGAEKNKWQLRLAKKYKVWEAVLQVV